MRYVLGITSLLPIVFISSCSSEAIGASDREMRAALESAWYQNDFRAASGNVRFVARGRKSDAAKGEDLASEFPLYRAYAEKGYLTISDEHNLAKSSAGWDDWFQMTQNGTRMTARVEITALGRQKGNVERTGETETLSLPLGEGRIEEIITNDLFKFGVDQFRVVQGTHTYSIPSDLAKAYAEARGGKGEAMGPERRFKALLKYDVFEKKWKVEATDIGPRNGEFTTNKIDQAVAMFELSKAAKAGGQ